MRIKPVCSAGPHNPQPGQAHPVKRVFDTIWLQCQMQG